MSIASTTSRNDYTGNGSASALPYTFRIFSDTDLRVTVRDINAGVETTLIKGTDYTVDGVGNSGGGNVNLVNSGQAWLSAGKLATGYKATLRRVRPLTQTTDIRNQGDFFPEIHEDSFDHAVMIAQQHEDTIGRSIKLPETVPSTDFNPTLPATLGLFPGSSIIINATGNGFSLGATSVDIARIAGKDTYANFKAAAAAQPTLTRLGYATDLKQLVFYTSDVTVGDGGWIVLGG